jgi:aspartate/methionine/tyrosine aminotransferase
MLRPILNTHVTSLKESATLAINQRAKERRTAGKPTYHFGFGQSPFSVHPKIQQELKRNSHRKEYLPTQGLPELRAAIASFYKSQFDYDFSAENVLIGPGSKELIFEILFILEGPLLIPAPSWVSYGPQAQIRGKSVVPILTRREDSYKLTPKQLKEECLHQRVNRQKILIINNPNNPTGAVYSDEELAELAAVAREERVIIISDEIYALIRFNDNKFTGFSHHYPEGTFVTGGLSKGHSAGGYRLGFVAIPEAMKVVMKALKALVSETFSAVSAPTQYAAIAAFDGDDDIVEYTQQCARIHRICGEYLQDRWLAMGAECPKPEGAFYVFPDFNNFVGRFERRGIETASQLCNQLLAKCGVAMLPSSDFYMPDEYLGCRCATVDYDGERVYKAAKKGKKLDFEFVEKYCPNLKEGCDAVEKFLKKL